ncbi:MAG: ABC transporter ATP-binding protein [Coprobacillaceae bacterium]
METILTGKQIQFSYGNIQILKDINIHFRKGKVHAIIGASGSGKTTLLSILSGISSYKEGSILYKGKELSKLNQSKYRQETGIIFQNYNLISYLSAIQNIIVAMDIGKIKGHKLMKAKDLLRQVGIEEKDWHRPAVKLSGGQQQRVAIARALATDSEIIFADEPTGNLDSKTGHEITKLLCNLAVQHNKCVICVTHDTHFKKKADIVYVLKDGTIEQ